MRIGSLFSGYGGLDIAVEQHFNAETVWHAEFEEAPSKVLAAHWPGVPNHHDVSVVDWAAVEPVDIITGGFPCQDVSLAGRRAGMTEGTRSNLWGAMRTAIETIRPQYAVIENVRGLLSATAQSDSDLELDQGFMGDEPNVTLRALGRVLGDLADIGFNAEWYGLRAADIGAPHGRYRVFILATNTEGRGRRNAHPVDQWQTGGKVNTPRNHSDAASRAPGTPTTTSDPQHNGQPAGPVGGSDGTTTTSGRRAGSVTTYHDGQPAGRHPTDSRSDDVRWGAYEPAIRQWEQRLGRIAPPPTELSVKGRPQLSPVFVEWMMGLNEGHVTSIDGISRGDQLKMLGNGVVPQQALEALRRMNGDAVQNEPDRAPAAPIPATDIIPHQDQ